MKAKILIFQIDVWNWSEILKRNMACIQQTNKMYILHIGFFDREGEGWRFHQMKKTTSRNDVCFLSHWPIRTCRDSNGDVRLQVCRSEARYSMPFSRGESNILDKSGPDVKMSTLCKQTVSCLFSGRIKKVSCQTGEAGCDNPTHLLCTKPAQNTKDAYLCDMETHVPCRMNSVEQAGEKQHLRLSLICRGHQTTAFEENSRKKPN